MEWYYDDNGQQQGPMDDDKIKGLIQSGIVTRLTMVWNNGMAEWNAADKTELNALFPSMPPPMRAPLPPPIASQHQQQAKSFCRNCGKDVNPMAVACTSCGVPPKAGKNFCGSCGAQTTPDQVVCVKCGVSFAGGTGKKSKVVAGVLAIVLGAYGGHQFYLGNIGSAIIRLAVSFLGMILVLPTIIMGVISIIEGIKYLQMTDETFEETYITNKKAWF